MPTIKLLEVCLKLSWHGKHHKLLARRTLQTPRSSPLKHRVLRLPPFRSSWFHILFRFVIFILAICHSWRMLFFTADFFIWLTFGLFEQIAVILFVREY